MPQPAAEPDGLLARARAAWPFAGRDEELAVITEALRPPEGRGAVVVAPAGVGKTRLLSEVRSWAEQQGLPTATVIATEAASHTPYGAVLHLLPTGATDLVDRASWHAAFTTALRSAAGPTLLLVDDAHHLDHGTAALLLQLVVEQAIIPLVAVRRGESVHDPITTLWKNGLALRVDLQPFSTTEMCELIGQSLGGHVSTRTLTRLAAVCDGNVLYARELVTGALDAGSLRVEESHWVWDEQVVLAPRLVEAVGARLVVLPEEQRRALALVALGEPLPPQVAEILVSPADLAALEHAGLIRLLGVDRGAVLRLAHPLYGEVVLAHLGQLTRRHLLIQLADALDSVAQDREAVFRVVSWRLQAGSEQSPQQLLRAAQWANQSFDHRLAERLARAGLQALGRHDALRLPLTVALSLALVRDNRHRAAHTLLAEIEAEVITSRDRDLQDAYLDTRYWACGLGLGHLTEIEHLLDGYADGHHGARRTDPGLSAYRANLLLGRGQVAAALTMVEPLVTAQVDGLPELQRLFALETYSEGLVNAGLHDRAAEVWDQMRAMAATGSGRVLTAGAEADLQQLWAAQLDGRYAEIQPMIAAVHAQLETSPDVVTRGLACLGWGRILMMSGQFVRAQSVLLDALADFRTVDLGGSLGWVLSLLSVNAAQTGRLPDAQRWREEAHRALGSTFHPRQSADATAADVWCAVAEGDLTAAAQRALHGAAHYPEFALDRAWQLHLAVRVGERGPTPAQALREIAESVECALPALLADHTEALRAQDGTALEAVTDRFAARGLEVLAAEAATQAASAHRHAGSTDGTRRASARALALRARFDPFSTPALAEPVIATSLSRRELDVARLAAQGLSNAAIAERLVLSVRTVESHLYQAFGKLGVEKRAELPRVLPLQ